MSTRNIRILFFIVLTTLLCVGYYVYKEFGIMHRYTVKDFAENPSLLDGATLRGGEFPDLTLKKAILRGVTFKKVNLDNLHLEDIILEGAIFDEVDIDNANFLKVTFNNCKFINTHIKESKFTNTNFNNSIFTYSGNYKDYYTPTNISRSRLENVVFDDCIFNRAQIRGVSGSAIMKNFNFAQEGESGVSLINATDFSLRVDNCNIANTTFAALFENSTLYATNSTLSTSGFVGSNSKVFYIENCAISGTVGNPELLIMKNSKFNGSFEAKTSYLINTDIRRNKQGYSGTFYGKPDSHMHIVGGKEPIAAQFFGGAFSLYDVELENYSFLKPTSTINLKNVSIRGGSWKKLRLSSGQWENVRIYPTVTLDGTTFGDLRVRNVSYPDGNPWKGKGEELQQSDKPFDWPEIKVPTPQELGLVK